MIISSSFRAYKVSEFVYIYLFYVPCFVFAFSRGVSCSFTHIFSFRRFTLPLSFRRLFGARQLTAAVSFAHVVMSSTTGANTIPLEPNVVIANEVHDAAGADDTDHVEFDLDELKEQLGIDSILDKLNDLAAKFCSEKSRTEYSGSEAQNSKSSSETAEGVFDPSAAVVSHEVASTIEPHEEEFKLPSVFEETESFGPEVAEVIAQRVNDACSKKAMDSKLKDLYEKYKTPANCKYLCVPKVNSELWHDLSKESKSKDLGLQELQKGIVKASQPIIQLFDSALKARKDKSSMDPNVLLSLLADAVTFLGHASFLTSLKRREFLKPDIARPYQSVCNKSNAITTCLFGDELPKHIKEIGEVNKISRKVSGRPTSIKNMVNSYKRGSDTPSRSYPQRSGRKSTFLGYRGRGSYFHDRHQVGGRSAPITSTKPQKDKV